VTGMRLPAGPLLSRNFQLLLACDIVSLTGSAVAAVAIPFAVLAIGGSAGDVGYVSGAALVSVIVFLLLGGVVADRLPRHRVMTAANALQALAQGASAVLILTGSARVWELMALAAARGAGSGFYYPAAQGLLPQTVPADQRAQANAMDRVCRNGAQIGGAALGGVLVGLIGPGWGLAADAASFAVAGFLRAGMRFPASPAGSTRPDGADGADGPAAPKATMLHELREGWRDFISRRWLWVVVLEFACVIAVYTATVSVLGPLVAATHFGGARSWGVILSAYAAGAVLGGIGMISFRPRRILLAAILSVPALAMLLFALAVPLSVPLTAATAMLAGAFLEIFSVSWTTTMQQEIPADKLSRLSAYYALGSYALAPVGTMIAGPVAGVFGTSAVLAAGGILIVALTVAVLFVPEVRNMRRQAPFRQESSVSCS
jgi:Major Facilitator Superfamily